MLKIPKKPFVIKPSKTWISEVGLGELKENPETLSLLCDEIESFGFTPYAIDMDAFSMAYRIRPQKLYEWRKKLPLLDEALNDLQAQIHINRRMLWGLRQLSDNNFLRYAHRYSAEEKEIDKYHDDRKKRITQEEDARNMVVTVERICMECSNTEVMSTWDGRQHKKEESVQANRNHGDEAKGVEHSGGEGQ